MDIRELINMARQGNSKCQAWLAQYYTGEIEGVKQDYKMAFEWAKRAFENGEQIEAPFVLALCLFNGQGIDKNNDLGYQCLCVAVQNGNKLARNFKKEVFGE